MCPYTIVKKQVQKKKKIIPFLWEIEKVVKILFAFIFFSHKNFSKIVY